MKREQVTLKDQIAAHYALSKQLNPQYDQVYGDMVVYLRTSNVLAVDVEEIINDILVMMLEAQARGESVEVVFGSDYQLFCDEMIASMGKGSAENRVKDSLHLLLPSLNISLFFSWFNTLDVKGLEDFRGLLTVDLSVAFVLNLVFMLISVFVLLRWLHRSVYSTGAKSIPEWRKALPGGLIFAVSVMLLAFVSRTLDQYVLMHFHVAWLLGLMGCLWIWDKLSEPKVVRTQREGQDLS